MKDYRCFKVRAFTIWHLQKNIDEKVCLIDEYLALIKTDYNGNISKAVRIGDDNNKLIYVYHAIQLKSKNLIIVGNTIKRAIG